LLDRYGQLVSGVIRARESGSLTRRTRWLVQN
jgi:hypothetical protein